jgi:hypothetical protein
VQNLIVPKQIAPGPALLLDNRVGQADRFRRLAVFIVIEGANICRLPSAEVPVCTVAQLIAWQMKAQFATRDVCIITDLERPSHEQAQVINALSGKQLRDHRIWLVTPEIDTRPSSR